MTEPVERPERDADPVNWRRTDGGVEIYDETNPEAWVRMEFVSGIDPEKRLFGVCDECGLVTPQRALPSDSMTCGNCESQFDADS